jgi:hypothetical protein
MFYVYSFLVSELFQIKMLKRRENISHGFSYFFFFPLSPALKKKRKGWTLVAHVCNPSYSGGRDQENCGSESTPGK